MIALIFSIGAVNAFIPLIIILILIVAAAGLMRGYDIFTMFGIPAMLVGARGSLQGKNAATQTAQARESMKLRAAMGDIGKKLGKGMSDIGKFGGSATKLGVRYARYYRQEFEKALRAGRSDYEASEIAEYNARIRLIKNKQKDIDNVKGIADKIKETVGPSGSQQSQLDRAKDSLEKAYDTLGALLSNPLTYSSAVAAEQNYKDIAAKYEDFRRASKDFLRALKDLNKEYGRTAVSGVKSGYVRMATIQAPIHQKLYRWPAANINSLANNVGLWPRTESQKDVAKRASQLPPLLQKQADLEEKIKKLELRKN